MSNQLLDFDQQLVAWDQFVECQRVLPIVKPVVADSWRRCWTRLHPYKDAPLKHLNADYLLAAQVASFDLISITRPVMEDIYQYVERSDTVIALVNRAGFILDILGDHEMKESVGQFKISAGAAVSESQMGTNAFGLALTERIPVRVIGPEHFLRCFHDLASAAAPIFDLSGRPLGALGIMTPVFRYHPHTLGLAVAGARAIEGQRQTDQLMAEQRSRLAQLNTILDTSLEGILVWNAESVLLHINPAAIDILGIPRHKLLGHHIGEFIKYPSFLREAVENRKPLTDVEVNINIDERSVSCVISLRYVLRDNELLWIIATARPEKDVRRFIQTQVGAHASLTLADLPGESSQIKRVHRFVRTAAPAAASILIRGERGTGKNPVASAIHNESTRREGPFLIFACSSIPSELVVSELLGVDEGVSNKTPGGRPSKFELAHGGTLYFQDVEALPLEAQGILLNVIDLSIVQRLGSRRPIPVDVRTIASSSANMEELIAQGRFRSDLFYRLSALEIRLPPLRERRKDLPILTERILRRFSRQLNRPLKLDPDVIEVLGEYSWPGNIRELESVLGRTVVQAGFSGLIRPAHLPEYIRRPVHPSAPYNPAYVRSLNDMEREAIIRAAELCHGNVSAMARTLEVGRTTVWRKLKAFDISPQDFRKNKTGLKSVK